ncbi:hypothetical protein F0562_000082 [Nyssa sinensis]|uniref:GH16 domain-containing protein n=1 Tax=Nyssa sinensis TaxID=561372 RepID=A0A5J5BZH6_9ASTE|nr:hypothetical protein F0562_000082 [Nyssa sinensis]
MKLHLASFFLLVFVREIFAVKQHGPSYDQNYNIAYGGDHVFPQHQGRDVQLSLDKSSGSGIQSKLSYSTGFFHLRIKLPGNDSGGVVTAFYMTSHKGDELDFEFLG